MGTSYLKAANCPDLRELIIDLTNPWEYGGNLTGYRTWIK